jgi:hypothetical protein
MMKPRIIASLCFFSVIVAPLHAETGTGGSETPSASSGNVESPNEHKEDAQPGDHWTYEIRDEITGDIKATNTNVVTDVGSSEINVRIGVLGNPNSGYLTFDHSWNVINTGVWRYNPNDGTGIRAPLAVGKTWSFKSNDLNSTGGFSVKRSGNSKVTAQETVKTRAGTFDTFKIETSAQAQAANDPTKKSEIVVQTWYAPQIDHWVKRVYLSRYEGRVRENTTAELVEYGRR